jgi:hypothetical protein
VSPDLAWLFAPAAAAVVLIAAVGPVRRAYANGWHCLRRHDALWKIPAAFVLAYALFQIGADLTLRWRAGLEFPGLFTEPPPDLVALVFEQWPAAVFPAAEMVFADLNCLVATFPVSAVFGALFLLNWRRTASELRRAMSKRFGFWGWLLFALLIVCAVCGLLKAVLMVFLPELGAVFDLRELLMAGTAINAFAFVFEYLLGTAVQVYLLLTAYGWMRGRHFPGGKLVQFAVRRLGFVLKWALVLVVATLAFIHLPLFVEVLRTGTPAASRVDLFARPVLLLIMLLGAAVPIRLALHNDSLRGALAANLQFLRRHGLCTLAFMFGAFGCFFTLKSLEFAGLIWLEGTLAGFGWTLTFQTLAAAAGGWILAAWVCYYTAAIGTSREIVF